MLSRISKYFRIPVIALMALAAASCSSQGEEPDGPTPGGDHSGEEVSLRLYLSLGNPSASRAPSDGDYDPGSGYENYIDLDETGPTGKGDFFVAVYNPDNSLVFIADDPVLHPVSGTASSKTYLLDFPVKKEDFDKMTGTATTKSFKILLLANWNRNYPTEAEMRATSLGNLFSSSDRFAISYQPGGTGTSPVYPGPVLTKADKTALFGVKEYNNVEFYNWQATPLEGTLHLIRALAKIDVYLSEETAQTCTLDYVRLTRGGMKAAPAPFGVVKESDYVKGSYAADYTPLPSIPTANVFGGDIPLTADDDGHYIIYVPEFANLQGTTAALPDNQRMRMKVKLSPKPGNPSSSDQFKETIIDFAYYRMDPETKLSEIDTSKGTGGFYNIMRNYWYKFELNRVASDLAPTVDVLPYGIVELEPDFGLDPKSLS